MDRINFEKFDVDQANRAITFSCASSIPYERYDQKLKRPYEQILVISESACDLTRLNSGSPLLFNHDADKLLGMVEKAWIVEDRVFVRVIFSKNDDFAERLFKDILDGIVKNCSIGYQVLNYREEGIKRYITEWMIYEVSIVSIPADIDVGIRKIEISNNNIKENNMEMEEKAEVQIQAPEEETKEVEQTVEAPVEDVTAEKVESDLAEEADELAELKKQVEALKAENENLQRLCGEQEKKSCNEEKAETPCEGEEQIKAIAKDFDVPDEEVKSALDKKLSVREFKQIVKEKSFNSNITIKENNKMNKREFANYLQARDFKEPFQMRDFTGFADAALVGTETTPLVAALDKRMGVKGFRTLNGLHNNVAIPVQTTRLTVAEKDICLPAEDSNPAFKTIELTPHKITGSCLICKEMLVNTNSDTESFVIDQLLKEISYKIEQLMLGKIAAAADTEITYANINSITYADILAMEAAIDGYLVGEKRFVMNPAVRAALKATPKAENTIAGFICEGNEVNGYPVDITGVSLNDNIYYGAFDQLLLATWGEGGIQIMVDPFTESRAGNIVVVASALVDAAVIQDKAFCVGKVQDSSSSSGAESSSSGSGD